MPNFSCNSWRSNGAWMPASKMSKCPPPSWQSLLKIWLLFFIIAQVYIMLFFHNPKSAFYGWAESNVLQAPGQTLARVTVNNNNNNDTKKNSFHFLQPSLNFLCSIIACPHLFITEVLESIYISIYLYFSCKSSDNDKIKYIWSNKSLLKCYSLLFIIRTEWVQRITYFNTTFKKRDMYVILW